MPGYRTPSRYSSSRCCPTPCRPYPEWRRPPTTAPRPPTGSAATLTPATAPQSSTFSNPPPLRGTSPWSSPLAATLPETSAGPPTGHVTIAGWGATREGGPVSDSLQWVEIPSVPDSQCKTAYGSSSIYRYGDRGASCGVRSVTAGRSPVPAPEGMGGDPRSAVGDTRGGARVRGRERVSRGCGRGCREGGPQGRPGSCRGRRARCQRGRWCSAGSGCA